MFTFDIKKDGNEIETVLKGRLDASSAPQLYNEMGKFKGKDISKITFHVSELEYISSAGLRVIIFTKQKLGQNTSVCMIGANDSVKSVLTMTGCDSFVELI